MDKEILYVIYFDGKPVKRGGQTQHGVKHRGHAISEAKRILNNRFRCQYYYDTILHKQMPNKIQYSKEQIAAKIEIVYYRPNERVPLTEFI